MRAAALIALWALAGVFLLGREAAPDAWALPVAVRAALALGSAAGAAWTLWRLRHPGARAMAAGLLALAAGAALESWPVRPDAERWRAGEEARLQARFEAVRTVMAALDARARTLAQDARRELAAAEADSASVPPTDARARLFDALAAHVREPVVIRTAARTPGGGASESMPAGVQVFDARGALVAWAGAPHPPNAEDRLTVWGGPGRATYFRRSGVYTLLSCEVRDEPSSTARRPPANSPPPAGAETPAAHPAGTMRALVDVPVEVRYRISNRFLRSRSLASDFSGDGIETDLIYDAANVPPYLAAKDLEVQGDESHGLQGVGVIRDAQGAPLVLCRLSGLRYADLAERAATRRDHAVRWLLLGAVLALGVAAGRAGRARGLSFMHGVRGAALVAALLVLLRWLAAYLGLPANRLGSSLLNPASFAMVGFGGVLRSPLDFLLSSTAIAAAAAVLLVARTRGVVREPTHSRPAGRLRATAGLVAGAVVVGVVVATAQVFAGRVAGDSNPYLLGAQLNLLSPAVACLHLGLLLGVAGALVLALLAADAMRGERAARSSRPAVFAAGGILGAAMWLVAGPVAAMAAVLLLLASLWLRPWMRDERFTSFGLAGFAMVALTAMLNGDAIQREYFRGNQARAQEAAAAIVDPADDLRRFVLEDLLQKAQSDVELRRALEQARSADRGALAFELWAQSMLSNLGFACELRVYDSFGQLTSEFAVDMPTGRQVSQRDLLDQARGAGAPVIRTAHDASPGGDTQSYAGAVVLRAEVPGASVPPDSSKHNPAGAELGAIVVELPFSQSSLDVAANPRARTPELLRNLQQEGIGPRVGESERLLLAWLDGGAVSESSTPYLEVGQPLRGSMPAPGAWQRLKLVNGAYLVTRVDTEGRQLLAGFRLPTPLDRVLQWTQVGSFGFAVATLGLLLAAMVLRFPGVKRRLPLLLVPKRLGFQQKLMAAFLVISLLPSLVVSIATRDIMRDRSASRNRDAALSKARAAEAALAEIVRRDLDAVRESEYVRAVLSAVEIPPARELPEFGKIMLFRGDGRVVLDETLSNLSDEQARAFVTQAPQQVFAARDGKHLCLGAMEKIWFSRGEGTLSESAPDAQPFYVYYQRRLTDELLRNLAPVLSTDLSAFLGPQLAVSSQRSLAIAGLLPTLVPPQAFTHVQLRHNRSAVVEERAGEQHYFAGYVPLEDAFGQRIGALAVSQLLQADEFAVEVERTRELVLGLSTLMFVLTLVLGVVFASRIFNPVRSLIEGTRRIAGGELGFRLQARSSDEIGELERSFNDMSERVQSARWALEERRRYLEAVLGHIASGVIATDGDGRITAVNPAAYRILRLEPGSLEGRHGAELSGSANRPLALFWARLREAPGGQVVEIPVHLAEGAAPGALERLTLRVIVTDLVAGGSADRGAGVGGTDDSADRGTDGGAAGGANAGSAGGESLGRVAIFEDVTDLIRSKKLSAWAEMARQVAHEIKNPLTPMKLSAQFMDQAFQDRSPKFPEIFRDGMKTIVEQVESLRRIASEFANFGRIQKIEPRPLALVPFLDSVTAPYRGIEGLHLDLVSVVNGDPAPAPGDGVQVLGDEEGLRKVFRNVLENAREAMGGRGRIVIRAERQGADRVQVRVQDSGPGVSADAAQRLFEPYFSTKSTGTGLGLAISKGIVEELGGSIALSNRPEGGAEVCITLTVC